MTELKRIARVVLKDFQAHPLLDLEVGPLTTLTGPTSSGKTSVLRALAGLLRNDAPTDLVRHGAKHLEVVVYFDDLSSVTWRKGDGVNQYLLTAPDGAESKLNKVGSGLPEEVADFMQMAHLMLEDGSKVNPLVHEQADRPFLVFDPAPSRAKLFGELTSAGKLFAAASSGNKFLLQNNKDLRKCEASLEENQDGLEQVAWVPDAEKALVRAASSRQEAHELADRAARAWVLSTRHHELASQHVQARAQLALLDAVDLEAPDKAAKLQAACTAVAGRVEQYNSTRSRLEKARNHPLLTLDLAALEQSVAEVEASQEAVTTANAFIVAQSKLESRITITLPGIDFEAITKLNQAAGEVRRLLTAHQNATNLLADNQASLLSLAEQMKQVQEQLDQIAVCPTCGQEIHD